MSNPASDPQVLEYVDSIGSMPPASQIIEAASNSDVTLAENYDATKVAEHNVGGSQNAAAFNLDISKPV